ncbi:LOW QUALITY PROTEIN: uncharacterized protein WCC33_001415 [Rhinophrynus dorsalis]
MGCSISCAYFEAFSSFLHWAVAQSVKAGEVAHYLDDFLFIGSPEGGECQELLDTAARVFEELGVPVAQEKTVGPSTCLTFLGIEIDSVAQVVRLPKDKVERTKVQVAWARQQEKVTLQQLQSLLGLLNFACRVIPMGRVFSRRLQLATVGVRKAHYRIRLSSQLKEDLSVWEQFLRDFNGTRLWMGPTQSNSELQLFTDASRAVGFGAYLAGKWCVGVWPPTWHAKGLTRNLAFFELFPIVVALELWHDALQNRAVFFWTDNMAVVYAVNQLTSASKPVLSLLRLAEVEDLTDRFVVRKIVKGWGRQEVQRKDRRRPVDARRLEALLKALDQVCASPYEVKLFGVAFVLAFHGAFRIGELVAPSKKGLGAGLQANQVECKEDRAVQAWILGHSFVFWAGRQAAGSKDGAQLGLPRDSVEVRWLGHRGLRWSGMWHKGHEKFLDPKKRSRIGQKEYPRQM